VTESVVGDRASGEKADRGASEPTESLDAYASIYVVWPNFYQLWTGNERQALRLFNSGSSSTPILRRLRSWPPLATLGQDQYFSLTNRLAG